MLHPMKFDQLMTGDYIIVVSKGVRRGGYIVSIDTKNFTFTYELEGDGVETLTPHYTCPYDDVVAFRRPRRTS